MKNFINEIIKDKKIIPGVGKYELIFDNNQEIREKYAIRGDKARKIAPKFKSTIFDDCHVDCIKVAPGSYNTEQV